MLERVTSLVSRLVIRASFAACQPAAGRAGSESTCMPLGDVIRRSRIVRLARRLRVRSLRYTRDVGLSNLFLVAAFVVVAIAMVGLGNWISSYLNASISRGVAETGSR